MKALASWYAFSRSSLTTILSWGASGLFANSISTLAWLSLLRMSASLSVARPLRRCSRMSMLGGERNRNLGRGNVGWLATCLTPWKAVSPHPTARLWSSWYLHLDIQDARPPLLLNVLNRSNARSIAVASKGGMLDEALLRDQIVELVPGHKVVLDTILLFAAGIACGVRHAEAEAIRVVLKETLEDGRLASARGAGYDNRAVGVGGRHGGGCGKGTREERALECGEGKGRCDSGRGLAGDCAA